MDLRAVSFLGKRPGDREGAEAASSSDLVLGSVYSSNLPPINQDDSTFKDDEANGARKAQIVDKTNPALDLLTSFHPELAQGQS